MLDATLLPLENERARLRRMREDDAAAYAEGTTDPDVRRFAHLPEPRYTAASVTALVDGPVRDGLDRGDLAVLAIADVEDDSFAGSLVIFDVDHDSAEVGFWLRPDARGAGLAAAALDLAVSLARESGLYRLTARTVTGNAASQRVLGRAGFTETGREPSRAPSGHRIEGVHYELRLSAPVFPVTTERLSLRLHRPGDEIWLQSLYARPEVARYLLDPPWTHELAARRLTERVEQTGLDAAPHALALVIERESRPIGDVLVWLTDVEHRVAEIGWVLDPAEGGRGYAFEAIRRTLGLAFGAYGLHRVAARMDARNTASARLAASAGMRHEAHLREDWWSKGEWTDTLIYGALATDRS